MPDKKIYTPFTRVKVKLTLPIKAKKADPAYTINCEGVIVRTEDKDKDGFNIAIFFNQINDSQRKKITEYINQFLPEENSVAASPNKRWGR